LSVTDNESGIDIMDPADNNTGAAGAVAVGWYGYQTPDGFISFMLQAVGGTEYAGRQRISRGVN